MDMRSINSVCAAKFGIENFYFKDTQYAVYYLDSSGVEKVFNPVDDDGDAFRLAVRCIPFHVLSYSREDYDACSENGIAATRLAIVKKVADI